MAKGFSISALLNATKWLRSAKDMEESIQDLEGALEDAADETKKLERADLNSLEREVESTTKEASQLEKKFREVRDEADKTGDQGKKSISKLGEGFKEAKNEAGQSGREAAASFSDPMTDAADFVQETLANAFTGLGPVAGAAGIALAAALGAALSSAEAAQEKLQAARERASELASVLYENKGTIPLADRVEELFELLAEESGPNNGLLNLIDTWVDFGSTLDAVKKSAKLTGNEVGDLLDAMTGSDLDMAERMLESVNEQIKELESNASTAWAWDENLRGLRETRTEIEKNIEAQKLAAEAYEQAGGAQAKAAEEAAERIKAANESVRDEQLGAYDDMRNAAYEKATADDAAFDVGKWLTYVEETRAAAETYNTNLQSMKLTPSEWENLLALPDDAKAAIVQSYATSGEEGKERIRAALSDGGAVSGAEATVGFDENFNPSDADVDINVDAKTGDAREAIQNVANKKYEASIKVKTTGKGEVKRDLDDLAKKRTTDIQAKVTGAESARNSLDSVATKRRAEVEVWVDASRYNNWNPGVKRVRVEGYDRHGNRVI